MEKLEKLGFTPAALAAWNRPVRSFIWIGLIAWSVVAAIELPEVIAIGLFADLGIYAGLRTYEKVKGV